MPRFNNQLIKISMTFVEQETEVYDVQMGE